MPLFRWESAVPNPLKDVFAWHDRPGAVQRLSPPWELMRVEHEAPNLEPGSRAVFRLAGPLPYHWIAEHREYRPPHEFRDVQISGPFRRWSHDHTFESLGDGGTRVIDEVEYELPFSVLNGLGTTAVESRLRRMFRYRHRQLAEDLSAHTRAALPPQRIAITGARGLIGSALSAFLTTGGHEVVRMVRREPRGPHEIRWDPSQGSIDARALQKVDTVIHLAGTPIMGRFTESHKQAVRDSRITGTRLIAKTLAALAAKDGPRTLITASAIGYYGPHHGSEILTEDSPSGSGFLAEVVRDWEAATDPASAAGVRVAHIRTGVVQTPAGGALRPQLPLFLLGGGGPLGSGTQWQSWISLDDIVGLYHWALATPSAHGPINGTAPYPVSSRDYARTLGHVLHRPSAIPAPEWALKLIFGGEATEQFVLASQRAVPDAALDLGYQFRHSTLHVALRHLLGHGAG